MYMGTGCMYAGDTMRTLCISDLHCPFHHPGALDFLSDLRREIKPQVVVCLGDEIDGHGWGRWARNPDAPGQGDELAMSRKALQTFYKAFPVVKVCYGNHTLRAYKTGQRAGLPRAFLRSPGEVLEAPDGWRWADKWVVDGVAYMHGDGYSGQNAALNAACKLRHNVVIGHIHAWAGVQYHTGEFSQVWGMNAGCMVDRDAIAMEYAKYSPNKQTLGTGYVIDGVPYFRPMRV
jgi:predicted phosphodiesterase